MSRDYQMTSRIDSDAFHHKGGQYIENDGARIYFEIIGNPLKPVLLVLHGGIGTMEDFNSIVPDLVQHFQLLGIDNRGHGKSTLGTLPLSYEQLTNDVVAVLKHLKIEELDVMGFSDGGIIGLRLAALNVLKIRKLTTIGAHWHPKNLDSVIEIYNRVTPESWKNKFPETFELYQRLNPEADFSRFMNEALKMWKDRSAKGYPGDTIQNIRCPVVIIHGEKDHLYSKADAEECASKIKNSKFVELKDTEHAVPRIDLLMPEIREYH